MFRIAWQKVLKYDLNIKSAKLSDLLKICLIQTLCNTYYEPKRKVAQIYQLLEMLLFQTKTQLRFTCSKSTLETLEKGKKYVQSY